MAEYAGLGEVSGKRVLVRSDLNVPLDRRRTITDDGRIRASVPTIKALADAGARVVVTAHLGRPKGEPDPAYSLAPVAARLGELLGQDVAFATDTVGESAQATVAGARGRPGRRARERAVQRGRDEQGRRRARRVRRPARGAAPDAPSSPTASASSTASRPRSTTSRSGCRTRWAAWSRPRSTSCAASPSTPSARTWSCSAVRRCPTSSA